MQVVVCVWQTQVFSGIFWRFFGYMFDLQLVKSVNVGVVDTEG